MGNPCVVGVCKNKSQPSKGIFMHLIPFFGDDRPEAKRRRKIWVDFVKSTRKDRWTPSRYSQVCSQHFTEDVYQRRFSSLPGMSAKIQPRLKADEIGITVYPTIRKPADDQRPELSSRAKRKIMKEVSLDRKSARQQPKQTESMSVSHEVVEGSVPDKVCIVSESNESEKVETAASSDGCATPQMQLGNESYFALEHAGDKVDALFATQEPEQEPITLQCSECPKLANEQRKLRNKIIDLKTKISRQEQKIKNLESASKSTVSYIEPQAKKQKLVADITSTSDEETEDDDIVSDEDVHELSEEDFCTESEETDYNTEMEDVEEMVSKGKRVCMTDDNLRTEPKFIVFFSKLLLLLQFCPTCKTENPYIEAREVGTMVEVSMSCNNPRCPCTRWLKAL